MTARRIAATGIACCLFFSLESGAQDIEVDDFDLGDHWVDDDAEGGWFSPFGPILTERSGSFRLDLSAGTGLYDVEQAASSSVEAEPTRWRLTQDYYAFATLQVPIDRLFTSIGRLEPPPTRADTDIRLAQNVPVEERAPEVATSPEAPDRASGASDEGEEPPPDSQPRAERGKDGLSSSAVGAQALSPPVVRAVVREIAERVGAPLIGAERRLKSLVRRSRWSGLSPELRLRGVLGFDRTTSTEESVGIYPGDTTVRGARDSLAEVRLTFRLDRLVLGDGEDSLERQRIDLEEEQRKLLMRALEVFSKWRLAEARLEDASLPPDEHLEAVVDAESAMLELHLMTDGWFEGRESINRVANSLPDVRGTVARD